MPEDLRQRYAEAIRSCGPLSVTKVLYAVMAVRDEELEQLRYERRLLGAARMVLDLVAAGDSSRWVQARGEAEALAQRIVDEVGHPATDEPALGPEWRERAESAEEALDSSRAAVDRVIALARSLTDTDPAMADRIAETVVNMAGECAPGAALALLDPPDPR